MNFSKTYRRMNEPVGPSPDLIRKTLSHPDRHRLPLRRLAAAAAVAAVLNGSAVSSDAALAQCAPAVAAMVHAALADKTPSARACKKLMFDYDVLRFGRLGAYKRMAANALGKREV